MVFISREVEQTKAEEENYSPTKGKKVVGKFMTEKEIENLLEKYQEQEQSFPGTSSYQIGVLVSMRENVKKWGKLTPKQIEFVERLRSQLPTSGELESWKKEFTTEMRERFDYAVQYYHKNKIQYFNRIVLNSIESPDLIPSKKDYDRFITNNKYSSRVLEEMFDKEPMYKMGDTVQLRGSDDGIRKYHRTKMGYWQEPEHGWCFLVLSNTVMPVNACYGCRRYEILPFGDTTVLTVEERQIKKARV